MLNDVNDRSRFDISRDIIERLRLTIKPRTITFATREVMCRCPWHKDTNPSCGIDLVHGVYHCFSCGRSGSMESMYKELTGESYYKGSIPISSFSRANFGWDFSKSDDASLKSVFVNYNPADIIPFDQSKEALKYLRNRGVSRAAAKELGFQFTYETRINNTLFKNRIIIPVYENKVLLSLEGRSIDSENKPKVLYPKNCTTSTLLDIDNLNLEEPCYGVEGTMDLAVLRSCPSFKNSTSIFGANITKRQLELIAKFKKFIYIPDLDEAGSKTVEQLKELDNIYILDLPKSVNGINIKDVGDLPKAKINPQYLVDHNWLNHIKKLTN